MFHLTRLLTVCTNKQNYSLMKTICKKDRSFNFMFSLKKGFLRLLVDDITAFLKFIWQVKLFQWRLLQIYWMNKLNKAFYSCLQKNCFSDSFQCGSFNHDFALFFLLRDEFFWDLNGMTEEKFAQIGRWNKWQCSCRLPG